MSLRHGCSLSTKKNMSAASKSVKVSSPGPDGLIHFEPVGPATEDVVSYVLSTALEPRASDSERYDHMDVSDHSHTRIL